MPTPIASIGQIAINTHDVPRAVAFYRDALGLEYLFEAGPLAFFMCGDVRLMLSVAESPSSTIRARPIYFRVDDIHAARAELVEPRRPVRRRAAPDRGDARPRAVDDVLPRPRPQRARPDERGQECGSRTATESSSPRSSGTVTLDERRIGLARRRVRGERVGV